MAASIPNITTTLDVLLQGKATIGNAPGVKRITKIVDMNPIPNSKQLVIKGLSQGTQLYPLTMNIFDVQYSSEKTKDFPLMVKLKSGATIYAAQIPVASRVQVRCSCKDFYYRWWYWNNKDKALAGPPMPAYIRKTKNRPEANPAHVPGACKHIISLTDRLVQSKILVR